jgi:hypothetical protein
VFLHGSDRNRVNVRQESDVDIGVLCRDTFFYDLPTGTQAETFGIVPASYSFNQFKRDLYDALTNHFGAASVAWGNKAFDVKSNSYRVEADVAPFFEYRRYAALLGYDEGVQLLTDAGRSIVNWPEQHYSNGVAKNTDCRQAFKGVVRILKRLSWRMQEEGVGAAASVPGFLLECMSFNVPDAAITLPTWQTTVRGVLVILFNGTMDASQCLNWTEVSKRKLLFQLSQTWTVGTAWGFTNAAWNYLGPD